VCILLVILMYMYHNAWFRECKISDILVFQLPFLNLRAFIVYKLVCLNIKWR